jgi:periplasmic mercuric ion binding protein
MKTINKVLFSFLFLAFSFTALAQAKSETIKVSGACGMCKKTIEKAAKSAGATYAVWNKETHELEIKYAGGNSNKIQQAVANAGYDTPNFKATNAAYEKLDDCCKYDRAAADSKEAHACCDHAKCKGNQCMKDGKCSPDMSCCKEAGCDKKACCKKD